MDNFYLECKFCSKQIQSENVDDCKDLAVCTECNTIYKYSDLLDAKIIDKIQ